MRAAGSFSAWAAVIIGAISLFVFLKRRKPRQMDNTPSGAAAAQMTAKQSIVAIVASSLRDPNGDIQEVVRSSLEKLCQKCNVFIYEKVAPNSKRKPDFPLILGLAPERILYCTSDKAFEAFTRQLKPSTLVVTDEELSKRLEKFVPTIVVIGGGLTFESWCGAQ